MNDGPAVTRRAMADVPCCGTAHVARVPGDWAGPPARLAHDAPRAVAEVMAGDARDILETIAGLLRRRLPRSDRAFRSVLGVEQALLIQLDALLATGADALAVCAAPTVGQFPKSRCIFS